MNLQRLAGQVLSVIVSAEAPDGDIPASWLWVGLHWLESDTGKWYKWSGSVWEVVHNPFNNANFTGTLSADGHAGITGTKVTPIGTLTFTKGLLTGFVPA